MTLSASPITQDALSVIVQNYNATVGPEQQLNDIDFFFAKPTPNVDSLETNSTILMVSTAALGVNALSIRIIYNRINLSLNTTPAPVYLQPGVTALSAYIDQINLFHGINLVPSDYTDKEIESADTLSQVQILPDSLMFVGAVPYVVRPPL